MKVFNIVNFPTFTYIDLGEDFIRVNKEDDSFIYKGEDYWQSQSTKEFIKTIENMDKELFEAIIKELNNATLR